MIIFHIDVNSAFLSWSAVEELKNGSERDLRTIPSIVGGDQASRHGIVLAKSVPAKRYGICTAETVASAFRKCPNLVTVKPDHRMYREYSRRLMDELRLYTSQIEQVSVDECYMNATEALWKRGISENELKSPETGAVSEEGRRRLIAFATEIKNHVYEKFGFTVNVGISTNKLLAKMASDFEKPDKVHTLFPDEIRGKMWPLPVGDLFMAGRSSVEVLEKLDIHTIGELANTDPKFLELHLKTHGRKLWESANGKGSDHVESERQEAKGVGNSTTLAKNAKTRQEAMPVLRELSESVSRRLKKAGRRAGMVSVEIRYATFDNVSHQRQLARPSNETEDLYQNALELFDTLWNGDPIRLLGVRTSKLSEEGEPEQLSIFDIHIPTEAEKKKREKKKKLEASLEKMKKKYGDDVVKRGDQFPGI